MTKGSDMAAPELEPHGPNPREVGIPHATGTALCTGTFCLT